MPCSSDRASSRSATNARTSIPQGCAPVALIAFGDWRGVSLGTVESTEAIVGWKESPAWMTLQQLPGTLE
jgi:hypothetical protein